MLFDISINRKTRIKLLKSLLLLRFNSSPDNLLKFAFSNFKMNEKALEKEITKGSCESVELVENEVENGKNKHLVKCKFCPSRILNPGLGTYSESKFELPKMAQKKNSEQNEVIEYEALRYFWQINDMYTFENICFSNTVDNIKYLACADCEIGPVGYHNMDTKISYVALARVNYGS